MRGNERKRHHHIRRPAHPKKTNIIINDIGGESLSAIKGNQDTYHQYAQNLLEDREVDHVGKLEHAHGRYEIRDVTVVEIDTEVSPFPHIAQIAKITYLYRPAKEGAEPVMAERIFGFTEEFGKRSAARIGKLARGHWSVENQNHWKRDATAWREDRSPKRSPRGAKNLALMRNALLAVIPFEEFESLNAAFDHYRDHRADSLKIIRTAPPIQN